MVKIGSIIRAKVTRIEPYGVYLEHGQEAVLVLAPEVSWSDRRPLTEQMRPGEEHDVFVLRYNYRDRIIVGSMRRLHPEENPYRELANLEPDTVIRGRVVSVLTGDDVTVKLPNGARGYVSKKFVVREVHPGDCLDLRITAIEVDEGRLYLAPVAAKAQHPNGSPAPMPTRTNA